MQMWTFQSDAPIRRRFFSPDAFAHPAKLHLGLLQKLIDLYTGPGDTLYDPMAGTGSLMLAATQQRNVVLRDLEPSYVELMNRSASVIRCQGGLFTGRIDIAQGDARYVEDTEIDHIIFSPPYACRTHSAGCKSAWERLATGKAIPVDDRWNFKGAGATAMDAFRYAANGGDNTGNKQGRAYWQDMSLVYARCAQMLPPHGKLIVIIKNHIRLGNLMDITGQTVDVIEGLDLRLTERHARYLDKPSLWQRRRREKGIPIVDHEDVLVFEHSH
jgi:DNA modification methylase